ncbi:hypothetical protein ACFXAE_17900 [Streptomyces sp. NPDC059454]|uniref:hypothetical protein n=1 Tax=Streptomyces sp. NPDC059454 TaxID=3346836 RepID=UPI00369D3F3B
MNTRIGADRHDPHRSDSSTGRVSSSLVVRRVTDHRDSHPGARPGPAPAAGGIDRGEQVGP